MKRILIVSMFVSLLSPGSYSQDTSSNSWNTKSVKLNISFIKPVSNKSFNIGNFAPVFLFKNKHNNYHEIELNVFKIVKEDSVAFYFNGVITGWVQNIITAIGIGYQFDYYFLKNKQSKFKLYEGASILHNYYRARVTPYASFSYLQIFTYYTTYLAFVPGIKWQFNDRFYLDFSFPLEFFEYSLKFQEIHNPILTIRQRKQGSYTIDVYLLREIWFRMGIGVNL